MIYFLKFNKIKVISFLFEKKIRLIRYAKLFRSYCHVAIAMLTDRFFYKRLGDCQGAHSKSSRHSYDVPRCYPLYPYGLVGVATDHLSASLPTFVGGGDKLIFLL